MLNNRGPNIEPWETPEVISSEILYDDPILDYFLYDDPIFCLPFWS